MKYPKEVHELRGELQAAIDGRLRHMNAPGVKALIAELNGHSNNSDVSTVVAIVMLRELERDAEVSQ